jgi:hypothetical protein
MWIIQEPKNVALWNKQHFEEEKTESVQHVSNIQYVYLLNKYIKCNVWRLAVRYDIYIYIYVIRQLKVNRNISVGFIMGPMCKSKVRFTSTSIYKSFSFVFLWVEYIGSKCSYVYMYLRLCIYIYFVCVCMYVCTWLCTYAINYNVLLPQSRLAV